MRYPALRFIIALHYVLAVLGAAGAFVWLKALRWSTPTAAITSLLVPIATIAVAEVLRVLLAIEANTRASRVEAPTAELHGIDAEIAVASDGMRWAALSNVERAVLVCAVGLVLAVVVIAVS